MTVLTMNAANLSFALCELIFLLVTLLVWAIYTADRWIEHQRITGIGKNRRG